jgi:DNA-binding IclR family transcriptional regulator
MSESIRAVDRALDVLLCFSRQTPTLTMTQVSERVGINKSTVHRLLATLETKRFVDRDPVTGIYRPGLRLLQMAFLTLEHNDLRRLASPFLHELCKQHRENVNLAVLDGMEVIYLDAVESPQRVKLAAATGERLPAFCTASGKAILAYLSDDIVKKILEHGMPKRTATTIVTQEAFYEDARQIRTQGFSISRQEYEEGINAVAAPICIHPIASISIAGPAYRLTQERMLEIGPNLASVAQKIAAEVEMAASPF